MTQGMILRVLIAVGALLLAPTGSHGQQEQEQEGAGDLRIRWLPGTDVGFAGPNPTLSGLYLIPGGGANTLGFVTDDFVVLIDTKMSGGSQTIFDNIRLVTEKPVTTIINTSAHPTHSGSNSEFPNVLQIIAHENTQANMARMDAFTGQNARFSPNQTFTDRMSLLEGKDRIDLYYFGAGHTNGDVVIVFPAFGVAYLGDLFPSKAVPLIDTRNGGSAVAFPQTLAKAVEALNGIADGVAVVVPGHSRPPAIRPILTWMTVDDLQEYADFNRDFLTAVQDAMSAGKSVDEATASLGLSEKYSSYDMANAKANVQAIYDELRR